MTPPAPLDPTARWAVLSISYTITQDGFDVILTTDSPCHLWMRHTTIKPQKHLVPATLRGITIRYDPRFCFVAYHDIEQTEPGDTLTHTFVAAPWEVNAHWWFYFHGEIAGLTSPSTSPIFDKIRRHISSYYPHLYAYNLEWWRWTSYQSVHDNPYAYQYLTTGIVARQYYRTGNWHIYRSALMFDTTDLPPDHTIDSASLWFYVQYNSHDPDRDIIIVDGTPMYLGADLRNYGQLLPQTGVCAAMNTADMPDLGRFYFPLTPLGVSAIKPFGVTKYGVRTFEDIIAIPPVGLEQNVSFGAGGTHPINPPFLKVIHTPPPPY